jgi:hypothetical protein
VNSNHVALQSILYMRSELFFSQTGMRQVSPPPQHGPVLHVLIEHAHTLRCQRSSYWDGYKQGVIMLT